MTTPDTGEPCTCVLVPAAMGCPVHGSPDTGETPEEPDEATCAVCGRDIFRPWIDGIQEPWKHWVEPLDHPAALRAIPSGDRLDVERLAAAMHAAGESIGADPATPQLYPSDASLIAAEYARLAATEPEEGRDA